MNDESLAVLVRLTSTIAYNMTGDVQLLWFHGSIYCMLSFCSGPRVVGCWNYLVSALSVPWSPVSITLVWTKLAFLYIQCKLQNTLI